MICCKATKKKMQDLNQKGWKCICGSKVWKLCVLVMTWTGAVYRRLALTVAVRLTEVLRVWTGWGCKFGAFTCLV